MKLKIKGDEAVIEGEGNFASMLMQGCKGKVKINTPLGKREVKLVKEFGSAAKKAKPKKVKV